MELKSTEPNCTTARDYAECMNALDFLIPPGNAEEAFAIVRALIAYARRVPAHELPECIRSDRKPWGWVLVGPPAGQDAARLIDPEVS